MSGKFIRCMTSVLLITSVIFSCLGCGGRSDTSTTVNSDKPQIVPDEVSPQSNYEPTESIELSDYLIGNIDLVHDELGGDRFDAPTGKMYVINEPGDITVTYSTKADEGLDVLYISLEFKGTYRAGNSAYSLFGCRLGDTSNDVHYRLVDQGFQPSITFDDGESLELYDGEWTLDYKCDNGFLNKMEVNCTKRTMAQALQSELVSGYYVAVLSGQPSSYAYIDKIVVSDNGASIAFGGVFEKGDSEGSDRQLTEYTTFTVFLDDNTEYTGRAEGGLIYYSKEEFIDIISSFNGLGLGMTVENGRLSKAVLMS